jgi:hypothetical protein
VAPPSEKILPEQAPKEDNTIANPKLFMREAYVQNLCQCVRNRFKVFRIVHI